MAAQRTGLYMYYVRTYVCSGVIRIVIVHSLHAQSLVFLLQTVFLTMCKCDLYSHYVR